MLELACIIALAVQDFPDFAIILVMLLANGFLGASVYSVYERLCIVCIVCIVCIM